MPVDAPLTFGQLSTWRSIETFASDRLYEVNMPATWDVRGSETSDVRRALQQLSDRHETLRTTYHVVDGQPLQRVHESLTPRLEVVEYGADGASDSDIVQLAVRATDELYRRAFPVVGDPGWHALLGTVAGRPAFVAISLSHLAVDFWAITELERQFRTLLHGGPLDGPAPQPRELARTQHSDEWATRRRGTERYWNRILNDGPRRMLPLPPPREREQRIELTLGAAGLATLAEQAAAAHKVSSQSVLMAMAAAALGRFVRRDRVLLNMQSANRFDRKWQSLISSMNQLVPMTYDVSPEQTIASFVRRVHLGAMTAYRYGSYDVDAAARWAESATTGGEAFHQDCWFNHVSESGPAPRPAGEAASCSWTAPRRQAGHPFYLRVNAFGSDWVEMSLRVDPDLMSADDVERSLRLIALGVHRALYRPDSLLADLADAEDPGCELPEDVFPRLPVAVGG